MVRGRRARASWPLTLALVCAALGWVVYEQLRGPLATPALGKSGAGEPITVAAVPAPPSFTMPSLGAFAEVTERPLFSPTRRAPAKQADGGANQALGATLRGIVISASERIALVKLDDENRTRRVRLGDTVRGWTVVVIGRDHVVCRRGEIETTMNLAFDAAPTGRSQSEVSRRKRRDTNKVGKQPSD